eukprot:6226000-Amphidinium_carterae.1
MEALVLVCHYTVHHLVKHKPEPRAREPSVVFTEAVASCTYFFPCGWPSMHPWQRMHMVRECT